MMELFFFAFVLLIAKNIYSFAKQQGSFVLHNLYKGVIRYFANWVAPFCYAKGMHLYIFTDVNFCLLPTCNANRLLLGRIC